MSDTFDEKLGQSESSLEKIQEIVIDSPVENNDTTQHIVQESVPGKTMETKSELINVTKPEIPDLNIELPRQDLDSNPPLPQSPSLAVQAEKTEPPSGFPVVAGSRSADSEQQCNERPNIESEKHTSDAAAAAAFSLALAMPPRDGMTVIRVMEVGQSSGEKTHNEAMGLPIGQGTTNITPMTVRGNSEDGNSTRTARTNGNGGRTVEGFLYESSAGPMFIVCTCHGVFLTPDEFVRHAGGLESPNPIRHIAISPVD